MRPKTSWPSTIRFNFKINGAGVVAARRAGSDGDQPTNFACADFSTRLLRAGVSGQQAWSAALNY